MIAVINYPGIKEKLNMQKFIQSLVILSSIYLLGLSCRQIDNQNIKMETNTKSINDTATFGSGCFWCSEAIFSQLNGVLSVSSGYSGGSSPNPTYEEVCSGKSGYTEVVQIIFNPTQITYDELLEVFWKTHDPTTLNKQGNDIGPQYRSVIFYHNEEQKTKALKYKNELNQSGAFDRPVVTAIELYKNYYIAEEYHQDYFRLNSRQPYCQYVIVPKLDKFKKVFKDKIKEQKKNY